MDILKLGIYPNIFLLERISIQTNKNFKLFKEFQVSLFHVVCSGFEIPKNQPLVRKEEDKPLKKGIAVECENEAVEYISPIFLRKKTEEILSIKV